MDFIEEVKYWVNKARDADPGLKVFGASGHKYQFESPVDMSEIHDYEQKYGLKLPENYVRILTELGCGAGPYYGLNPLSKTVTDYYMPSENRRETFFNSSLTEEKWAQTMQKLEDVTDDEFDEIMGAVVANAIIVGTQGCTLDNVLMCDGSENGKVIIVDWNLNKKHPPVFSDMTFEEWYIGFFKAVVAHEDVSWYGMHLCQD